MISSKDMTKAADLISEQVRVLDETAKDKKVIHGEIWIGAVIKDSMIQEVKVQPSHRILVSRLHMGT